MESARSLIDHLLTHAQSRPHRAALLDIDSSTDPLENRWQTWNDLAAQTVAVARWLLRQRIEPGSVVASILPNSTAWITLDLACQAIGAIHAPIDGRYPTLMTTALLDLVQPSLVVLDYGQAWPHDRAGRLFHSWDEIDRDLEHSRKQAEQTCDELARLNDQALVRRSLSDVATILFTSGTTDSPKGVMLSRNNLISNARGKLHAMPQSSTDRRLNFLPFSHSYARTCELSTWLMTGGEMILARHMKYVVATAQHFSPTLLNGVPLFFEKLRHEILSLSRCDSVQDYLGGSIRQLASGGAALNHDTATFFENAKLPILVGYGLTEASPVVCSNLSSDGRTDNVGPAIPGVRIRVDSDGELWVSGSGVMQGYYNNPQATAEVIVEGELRTGDLAEIDSKGRVRLIGRVRDTLVLSSGVKVAPYQIEKKLKNVAGIEDVIVIGDGWERCAAVVVVSAELWKNGLLVDEVRRFEFVSELKRKLAVFPSYAVPLAWLFRRKSFSSDPNLVNFKGAPRRNLIRLQYEAMLRESIRSGNWSVFVESGAELPSN